MRIWGKKAAWPVLDLITLSTENIEVGKEFSARSLADLHKLYKVTPNRVESQLNLVWDGKVTIQNTDIKVSEKKKI